MLTASITYLINVLLAVMNRDAMASRLWVESGHTGDGSEAVVSQLEWENASDIHVRLRSLTGSFYELDAQLRRFPVLDLLYRSSARQ